MATASPITFIRQSLKNFRTIGSVAPSSPFMGRAVVKALPKPVPDDYHVLEVGPGTGPITRAIAKKMNGSGHLDLFEISPHFCTMLRKMLSEDNDFKKMQHRTKVCEGDIRGHRVTHYYDLIVSGLPFNCFKPDEVEEFLAHYKKLVKPGGVLMWYEYLAIRTLQSPFVSSEQRKRLKAVGDVTRSFARRHQFKQHLVPINIPPARLRLMKFG